MNRNIHVLSRAVVIDQGHILLCKTLDLPVPFYFLPGGHVEHGESVEATVLRELEEEAGVKGTVKRLLGCLEHHFEPGHNSICHNHEYNFIFEVTSPFLCSQVKVPQRETHIELQWIEMKTLSHIDFRPDLLKILLPKWLSMTGGFPFESVMKS